MKRAIVFVNGIYPVLSETFIYEQFRALRESGLHFTMVSARRPKSGQVHPHMRREMDQVDYLIEASWFRVAGALLKLLFTHPLRLLRAFLQLFSMEERKVASLAHIIGAVLVIQRYGTNCWLHSHFTYNSAAICVWAKRLADLPYSMTLHGADLTFDQVPDLALKLAMADRLVSISQHNLDYIAHHFPHVDLSRAVVIPLGVRLEEFQRQKTPFPPGSGPLKLINVGRLSEHKAQQVLIDACARLRDLGVPFQCDIIGEGPLRARLEERISRHALQQQVRLLGKKFHKEVLELLPRYHLFVMTSVVEGMPIAIMEAMAMGIPVIATRVGAVPELLDQGRCGLLFDPGNVQCLVELLKAIQQGETDTAELAHNARKQLENHFNLMKNASKFGKMLEKWSQSAKPEKAA